MGSDLIRTGLDLGGGGTTMRLNQGGRTVKSANYMRRLPQIWPNDLPRFEDNPHHLFLA